MTYKTVRFTVEGPVATLTFHRPEKLNALNQEMLQEISRVLAQVAEYREIRSLILAGQGRAFMAGADIQMFLEFDPLSARRFSQTGQEILVRLEDLPIPVIAAVQGYALGGGLEIAMACDLIYAAEGAKFGQPEINLGIIPGFGGTQRLARLAGLGRARELCFTGRHLDAREALALGLVAQVFPAETLRNECQKTAQSLARKSRTALASLKRVMQRGPDLDLKSALALESEGFALCFASPDAHEGARAFLEKRPPRFEE